MKKGKLQIFIVFVLLVVIPAISWVYLKKGLSYRLERRSELVPISKIAEWNASTFEHKYLVIHNGNQSVEEDMQRLAGMFADRDGFLLIAEENQDPFKNIDLEPNTAQLVDSVGQVLQEYDLNTDNIFAQLAGHLVYLAPVEKRRDFEFRRRKES